MSLRDRLEKLEKRLSHLRHEPLPPVLEEDAGRFRLYCGPECLEFASEEEADNFLAGRGYDGPVLHVVLSRGDDGELEGPAKEA